VGQVNVAYEYANSHDSDPAEAAVAVATIGRIAPRPDEVTLVITGDFLASNRSRLTTEDGETYDADRTFGVAAARTLPRADGTIDILVASPLLHSNVAAEIGLQRLVSHEAYHAAIHQRGETLGTIRVRQGIPALTQPRLLQRGGRHGRG